MAQTEGASLDYDMNQFNDVVQSDTFAAAQILADFRYRSVNDYSDLQLPVPNDDSVSVSSAMDIDSVVEDNPHGFRDRLEGESGDVSGLKPWLVSYDGDMKSGYGLNPYGHVEIESIPPQEPSITEFEYHDRLPISKTAILPERLVPPPAVSAPSGYVHPQSPVWVKSRDAGYAANICYVAPVSADPYDIAAEKDRQLCIAVPPNVDACRTSDDTQYRYPEVPGCVMPEASIPFAVSIMRTGRAVGTVSFACFHTPESLKKYYPLSWERIEPLARRLYALSFGVLPSWNTEEIIPLFAFPHLKQNDRASNHGRRTDVPSGRSPNYDGSYSLTITVEQGHGVGTVKAVSQLGTPAFRCQLREVIAILKSFYMEIVPLSVSALEWALIKFQLDDNNVFTMGGLGPSGISVQMNVSSSISIIDGDNLAESIGRPQGKLHPDPMDSITGPTLLTVLLKLPKDAVGGSMLLARFGLHIPFWNTWIINLVFDARTIHGARNVSIHNRAGGAFPTVVDTELTELSELWAKASQVNRIAYVQYLPHQAVFRTGNIAFTPRVDFGNVGTLSVADAKVKTFSEDGLHVLGSLAEAKSRFAREATFAFFNTLAQAGICLPGTASNLIDHMVYFELDDNGSTIACKVTAPERDILNSDHREYILRWRSYLAWYYRLRLSILLNIKQEQFFKHQDELLQRLHSESALRDAQRFGKQPSDFRHTALIATYDAQSCENEAMLDLDTSSLSSLEDEAESDILSCGQTVGSIEVDRASDAQSDLDVRYVIPSTNGVRRVTKATVSPLDNASTERNVDTVRQLRSARKVVLDKPPGRTVGVSKSGGTSKTIISSSESRKPAEKRGKAKTTASLSKSLKSVGKSGKIKTTVSSSESLKPTERTGKTKNNKDVGLIGERYVQGSQTYGNYEVENILDHEYRRGCIHYLLEFKGYEKSTAYWYKAVDLRHVVQIR